MTQSAPSRRHVFSLWLGFSLAFAAAGASRAAPGVCIDPDNLADEELALRASLKFQETAADPAKPCAVCAFYTAGEATPDCGECKLLHGPVKATSSCASWAKK